MNKELLEKAALEYAAENMWYPGDTSYEGDILDMMESFSDAFKAGAEYRINSVWHSNSENPSIGIDEYGCGKDCLVKPKYSKLIELGQVLFDENMYAFDCGRETHKMDEVECWAYIDDLLPEKEGGEE